MIIDFLLSDAGLRADKVQVTVRGVKLVRSPYGLAPERADDIEGSVHFLLSDISSVLTRPEIVNFLVAQVSGLAKPELKLRNRPDGGIRVTGSVEIMGVRLPVTSTTRLRIEDNKLFISATELEGLPLIGHLPVQLLDIVLPVTAPAGINFVGVSTAENEVILHFVGKDFDLSRPPSPPEKTEPVKPEPAKVEPPRPGRHTATE